MQVFDGPTPAQEKAWPAIARNENTLLLAPTGSGKTLAAFLVAIDRIMFRTRAESQQNGVRLLYISPLKALGVDVERNLKSPLAGVRAVAERDRVVEGEFLPGSRGREWCDVEVLRTLKRRSLSKLRKQIEPVEQTSLGRFLPVWQGIDRKGKGLDGLLDVIEQLQGVALPASDLERFILPARLDQFEPSDLDELCAAGEVVWRGCGSISSNDGRIALFLADQMPQLAPPIAEVEDEAATEIRKLLAQRGALFFDDISRQIDGFHNDLLDTLWQMAWCGEVTNDTLAPLRSLRRQYERSRARARRGRFRSRRTAKPPGSEGRWSLLARPAMEAATTTQRQAALAAQLIERYGVVTRELVTSEGIAGGFSSLYPVFKAMEESGRIRRGYFVEGLGAAQFAAPGAEDRLREHGGNNAAAPGDQASNPLVLAATDPANPFGAALRWPERPNENTGRPGRAASARVILHNGRLLGYLGRTSQSLITFPPSDHSERSRVQQTLARALAELATSETAVFLTTIDGQSASLSPLAAALQDVGFVLTSRGLLHRRLQES